MSTDLKPSVPTVALTVPTHAKLAEIKKRWKASSNLRRLHINHDMLIGAGLRLLDQAIDWKTLEDPQAGAERVVAAMNTVLMLDAVGQEKSDS